MPRPRRAQHPVTGVARSVRPPAKLGPMPTQEASVNRRTTQCAPARGRGVVPKQATQVVDLRQRQCTHAQACVVTCTRELSHSAVHRQMTTSPSRTPSGVTKRVAQRRSREHGFGGGRRRAAGAAGEHRRVPPSLTVVMRGGSSGERGIRTLGRLLTYVRLASGRGCPHRPVLGPSGLRASCLPQIPCSALRACARNGGGRRDSQS